MSVTLVVLYFFTFMFYILKVSKNCVILQVFAHIKIAHIYYFQIRHIYQCHL